MSTTGSPFLPRPPTPGRSPDDPAPRDAPASHRGVGASGPGGGGMDRNHDLLLAALAVVLLLHALLLLLWF